MDKLIQLAVEARLNDTRITQIEQRCYSGEISSDLAFELVCTQIDKFNQKLKEILNEPVKVDKNQFMLDRQLEALNIN